MKFSSLIVILVVLCLQEHLVGGKKHKKTWTVSDGWEKSFTEGQKNYLFNVVKSNYEKYDNYGDMAVSIRNQIYNENNGTKLHVMVGKKIDYTIWYSHEIKFQYGKKEFVIFE